MKYRNMESYAQDMRADEYERELLGDHRFQVVEGVSVDGATHFWEIIDLTSDLSKVKSAVISRHADKDSCEFVLEILRGWERERAAIYPN